MTTRYTVMDRASNPKRLDWDLHPSCPFAIWDDVQRSHIAFCTFETDASLIVRALNTLDAVTHKFGTINTETL